STSSNAINSSILEKILRLSLRSLCRLPRARPRPDFRISKSFQIPRACPVEAHVCCYLDRNLPHGPGRCHGLDPWSSHVYCWAGANSVNLHPASGWHPSKTKAEFLAVSVTLHGASPWHIDSKV